MKNQKGFLPIFVAIIVILIGGGIYAIVNRSVLKSYFEKGDKPTAEQFSDTIDSSLNRTEDRNLLGLKEYNSTKQYQAGDTVVKSSPIYEAKVLSQDQKEFKLDGAQDVTFRWTPVVPKPQEPVTYRMKVWQLMQGQSGSQAMKSNQPIITKDVDNLTEATVSNIYTGPCKPPYLCDYIWSVEVIKESSVNAETSGVPVDTNTTGSTERGTTTR
jgi:hypothetical protein